MKHVPARIAALVALGSLAAAQANAIPGLDIRISAMRAIEVMGRTGTFPDGMNGVAIETTVCNEGTVEVPWFEPMNPAHPKIAFLITSVQDGRMIQLSRASYVKHGFFALNGSGCQTQCIRPGGAPGEHLGVGCSDTYATANNGDNFYLGPAEEVDPWLGTWQRRCSLFDRGFPDVGAPDDCDGHRSLTHQQAGALGQVNSRIQISDEELIVGTELYFEGMYVVEGQPEAARDDSLASRLFTGSWNGNRWILTPSGPFITGSVLQRWAGATVTSATNGNDDGRVYVGLRVTGPVDGFYRYEYALHNRDNARGIGELHIPLCSGARVRATGFHDVDHVAATDWSATRQNDELVFAHHGQLLAWNTIFNFWFESDAAPADASLVLVSGAPTAHLSSFTVPSQAPLALFNVNLGAGCSRGTPPTLYAVGTPARAALGNASFGVASSGNEPFQPNFLYYANGTGAQLFRGCTVWLGPAPVLGSVVLSDANGVATHAGPVPNDIALEGLKLAFQAAGRTPGRGTLFGDFELSDGLLVRFGDAISACP